MTSSDHINTPHPVSIVSLALVAFLFGSAALHAQKAADVSGPLIGHVTAEQASVWMFIPKGSEAELSYRKEAKGTDDKIAPFQPIANPAVAAQDAGGMPVIAKLKGLEPNTAYQYSVRIDGKNSPQLTGTFRSATPVGKPAKFRVALTSCMKIGKPQGSWTLLMAQQPDLHLTIGDTHYADTTEPKVQWQHHLRYRREKEFAEVLRKIPTYSMWTITITARTILMAPPVAKKTRFSAGNNSGRTLQPEPHQCPVPSTSSAVARWIFSWLTAVITARLTVCRTIRKSACLATRNSSG